MKFRWLYTGSGTTEAGTKWNFVTDKGGAPVKEHGAYLTQGGLTQNRYGIIESFLGTHETKVKCTKVDPATGNVTLRYTVTNEFIFSQGRECLKSCKTSVCRNISFTTSRAERTFMSAVIITRSSPGNKPSMRKASRWETSGP